MNWFHILSFVYLSSPFLFHKVGGSGLFELDLRYFQNERNIDHNEKCCSGKATEHGHCIGTCKTRFRACLKHYQATIDTTSPCTFGDVITPVLEGSSLNFTAISASTKDFENPLRFPFEFGWPGYFTLIIEAWHDTNETTTRSSGILISRLSIQRILDVSAEWMEDSYNSSHTMIRYAFRVTCDSNYYGPGCANLCRKRDDQFGHYTCSPLGERVCLSGWQGEYCTFARCSPGCTHGHCTKPNECICQSGWKGPLCDECEPYPGCVYGTCKKPWECLCKEGWGGLFCNQDLNFCTNHKPCQNGGTCFNTGQGSYTCQCRPGYTGTDCELIMTSCSEQPCLHGATCESALHDSVALSIDSDLKYRCLCMSGWMGSHCEFESVTCAEKPCHHGTCIETINAGSAGTNVANFRCECPPGYSGPACEIKSGECHAGFCVNGGTCHVAGSTSISLAALLSPKDSGAGPLMCLCPDGFVGDRCEENVDDCFGNPCLNGGTCIDGENHFKCQCVPGFIGTHCEERVDLCLTKPCANGGTCTNLKNDYSCKCRAGFSGKDCSADVDECASSPCRNGGTCINRVNSFQCVCSGGYRGVICELESSGSKDIHRPISNVGLTDTLLSQDQHSHQQLRHRGGDTPKIDDHHNVEGLTNTQIALIAILSIATPLAAFIATAIVICLKRKRQREQDKDDAEARKQNEQNASHNVPQHLHHHHLILQQPQQSSPSPTQSHQLQQQQPQQQQHQQQQQQYHSFHNTHITTSTVGQKRTGSNTLTSFDSSHHMIKNTWDKSVNNMPVSSTTLTSTVTTGAVAGCGTGGGNVSAPLHLSSSLEDTCLHHSAVSGGSSAGTLVYLSTEDPTVISPSCLTLKRAKSQKQLNTDPTLLLQHNSHHNTLHIQSQCSSSTLAASTSPVLSSGSPLSGGVQSCSSTNSPSCDDSINGGKDIFDKRISVLSESRLCPRWNAPVAGSHPIVGPCSPPHI